LRYRERPSRFSTTEPPFRVSRHGHHRNKTRTGREALLPGQDPLAGCPTQTESFQRLTDARRWAQSTEAAIREGRHFKTAEAKRHTMADLIDRYIRDVLPTKPGNARNTTALLEFWRKALGARTLADITPALIAEQRDALLAGKTPRGTLRQPATVVRYLSALSHVFTVAMRDWQWVEDNPVRKIRKPREGRGRCRFLSDEERERLLTACRRSTSPHL
jgi:integrase